MIQLEHRECCIVCGYMYYQMAREVQENQTSEHCLLCLHCADKIDKENEKIKHIENKSW